MREEYCRDCSKYRECFSRGDEKIRRKRSLGYAGNKEHLRGLELESKINVVIGFAFDVVERFFYGGRRQNVQI